MGLEDQKMLTNSVSSKGICYAAALGSGVLLLGAFVFQILGYAPCAMCIWQRYPHAVAIGAGVILLAGAPLLLVSVVGAVAALTTSAIGVFHTGVERDWWEGPSSCTGTGLDLTKMSAAELLPGAASGPVNLVMCDQVAWEFLSLSMASWNAMFSAILAGMWLLAGLAIRQKPMVRGSQID